MKAVDEMYNSLFCKTPGSAILAKRLAFADPIDDDEYPSAALDQCNLELMLLARASLSGIWQPALSIYP